MAYFLALIAALCFALGSVLQQKGTLETGGPDGDSHFLREILRKPVWLAGGALQASGWVLQAAALDRGSLVVVQSITAMSLVVALPLGARITAQRISTRVVVGAVAMVVGIVLFLAVGSPSGGTSSPPGWAWALTGVCAGAAVAGLRILGRRRVGAMRALFLGTAAGVCYAMQAAVTKVFVPLVGKGLPAILSNWSVYLLVVTAVAGFVFQQSALKTGVLAPAMASSNAMTLFASIVLGTTLFGERLSSSSGLTPALVGLTLALVGVVLLSGAESPRPAEQQPTSTSRKARKG